MVVLMTDRRDWITREKEKVRREELLLCLWLLKFRFVHYPRDEDKACVKIDSYGKRKLFK